MSAVLAVEALTFALGDFCLEKLEFAVSRGEILVILGPNGAGKSVTLETIAGFHRPDMGRILIAGRDVTALPPEQRHVGFVVQNFGLFPHLNVAQNVAMARRRGRHHPESIDPPLLHDGDVGRLLAHFGITHLANRAPADLSPGEKQRVALARALAGAPDLFLFDEPFSALDVETRARLRDELKLLLRGLGIAAVFVTHDRDEAMVLADSILVLRAGRIVQSGAAADVFQRPANSFVARFLGIENVLEGRVIELTGGTAMVEIAQHTLRVAAPTTAPPARSLISGCPVFISIRAEDVTICPPRGRPPAEAGINWLSGRVTGLRYARPLVTVAIDCDFPLKVHLLEPQARVLKISIDSAVDVRVAATAIRLMPD